MIAMNTRTIYQIYVRPPGSHTWTQHLKRSAGIMIPWRSGKAEEANREAVHILNSTRYCAMVTSVKVPSKPDSKSHHQYALLADGDTLYLAAP